MGYLRLPLEPTTSDELAEAALDALVNNIPGFIPADGHLEVWMVLIWARMHAENRQVTQTVGDDIFQYFGNTLVNIPPIAAAAATTTSTWTMVDDQGYTIEAGTLVGIRLTGDELIPFEVVNEVVVAPGDTETDAGEVLLRALQTGTEANNLPAGIAEPIEALAFVADDGIVTLADTAGGVDAESDSDYRDRLQAEFELLAPRPIHASEFAVFARRVAGVHRALGLDLYSPARTFADGATTNGDATLTSPALADFTLDDVGRTVTGAGIPGGTTITTFTSATEVEMSANATATAAGVAITLGALTDLERAVTVAVVDESGDPLDQDTKDEIEEYLESVRETNFKIGVIDATYTEIDVEYDFTVADGYDGPTIKAATEAAVAAFLSPANWGGGTLTPPEWHDDETTVRLFEIAHVVYSVAGVNDVTDVTLNGVAADVVLAGAAPLPTVGTVTGTVV